MIHGFDINSPLVCEGIIGDGCGGGRLFFVKDEALFTYDPTTKEQQKLLKNIPNANNIKKNGCIITIECQDEQIVFDLSLLKRIFYDKKLIIYDFDGTLIDSVPDLALALNLMLEDISYPTYDEDTIRNWVGNGATTLVKRALSAGIEIKNDIDKSLFQKALDIFLDYYKQNVCIKTKMYSDVKDTLESLQRDGYLQAIVTNKPYEFIEPILEGLDIKEFISYFIGGDSLDEKKPSPKPLLYVCERLNIDKSKTIMIGDSKNDILSAQNAKIEVVGVSYGYNYGEDIAVYKPSIVIDEIKTLKEILR
jgi:phosphoglycolate phosphatase